MNKLRQILIVAAKWSVRVVGHLLGTALVFSLFLLVFMSEAAMSVLQFGLQDEQMASQLLMELGLIFGVSTCVYALGLITFSLVRETRKSRKKRVVTNRGTILTETLIVLPVFFMLTFGLAQMGINSMAGLLTTLGTYQAARTVAVWAPEVGNNRMGSVSNDLVTRKARIAAAGVITPVAPSLSSGVCDTDDSVFTGLAENLAGTGVGPWSSGIATSRGAAAAGFGETPRVWSFVDALDTGSFSARGYIKLNVAYCNTSVAYGNVVTDERSVARNQFDTTVVYTHRSVFPLVGRLFETGSGPVSSWPSSMGTSAISRTYTYTQQISPNTELPD